LGANKQKATRHKGNEATSLKLNTAASYKPKANTKAAASCKLQANTIHQQFGTVLALSLQL